ncbi:MAG: hypothetical protein ABGY09_00220, partial [Euryarchaeota archaeon]
VGLWRARGDVGAASRVAYVIRRMEDDGALTRRLLSVLPVSPGEDPDAYPLGLIDVALIPHLIARRGE